MDIELILIIIKLICNTLIWCTAIAAVAQIIVAVVMANME